MTSANPTACCSPLYALAIFAFSLAIAGCNEAPEDSKSSNPEAPASEPAEPAETTSVPTIKTPTLDSPAEAVVKLPDADALPNVVCLEFMKLLRGGDRLNAEHLLTRTAFSVTTRADWQLPPIGSSSAEYEMGEVRYATSKQKLAQVDCKVIDRVDGKQETYDVTWLVRRKKAGWRISGMLIDGEDEKQPKDLVSFENPVDVAMIKETMDSEANAEAADLSANPKIVGDQEGNSTETVLK